MVKEGYKRTIVGTIPADWDIKTLSDPFKKIDAGVSVNSDEQIDSKYYILKTSAIRGGIVDCDKSKPVVKMDYPRLKCPIVKGSIIISRMNTPALVGECGYVSSARTNTFLPDRLWQIRNTDPLQFNFIWLNYLLNTLSLRNAVRSTATGTSNSMKNIAKERLLEIPIPFPQYEEQNTIADALSEIDKLIVNLEKLIAKKKAIKLGVMQELLTGKRRLKGFTDKWKPYRIGNLGDYYGGLSGKTKADFGTGNARYITFLNILTNTAIDIRILEKVNISDDEKQNAVQKGDLFFNTSSETPEEVGMCAVLLDDLQNTYLNSFCFGFRLNDADIDPLFFSYYFNSQEGRCIMRMLAQGATRYNLSKAYFSEVLVVLPLNEEQIAIASIISDVEKGIQKMQSKLIKYRQIKSGMMSELLTGRIRLV